jgi:hypothetical protein
MRELLRIKNGAQALDLAVSDLQRPDGYESSVAVEQERARPPFTSTGRIAAPGIRLPSLTQLSSARATRLRP